MSMDMTRRSFFFRAGAVAVLAPAALAGGTTLSHASQEEVDTFFNSGFNYCQAEKLGMYWQMSTWDAKANGGAKIMRGEIKYLRQAIRKAAKRFNCSTTGFNYRDSDSVAEFWKHA
jgi:hypothetical protein